MVAGAIVPTSIGVAWSVRQWTYLPIKYSTSFFLQLCSFLSPLGLLDLYISFSWISMYKIVVFISVLWLSARLGQVLGRSEF